jgi:hypothetical protein
MPRAAKPKATVTESMELALESVREEKAPEPKAARKKEEESAVVKAAATQNPEKIIQDMAKIKLDITRSIDALSENLLDSFRKFSELEKAVEIEKKNLEETYRIRAEGDALAALLEAQNAERERFAGDGRQADRLEEGN